MKTVAQRSITSPTPAPNNKHTDPMPITAATQKTLLLIIAQKDLRQPKQEIPEGQDLAFAPWITS